MEVQVDICQIKINSFASDERPPDSEFATPKKVEPYWMTFQLALEERPVMQPQTLDFLEQS